MNALASQQNGSEQKPLTIYEVTSNIEKRLTAEPGLQNIGVIGEIVDYKLHSSGHAYFTLTDKDGAQKTPKKTMLKCTFFRFQSSRVPFVPKAGMEVVAFGSVSVYYQGGQYNFNVRELIEVGKGNLWQKIQELKKKLIQEGIIDPESKKKLPEIPKTMGIVTGLGTAALKDILKQVKDRYPNINIVIAPAVVQGEAAPESISRAIEEIGKDKYNCDVILVSRGGGGPEDLLCFSDELVCRTIHACPVPVVSAIGHQIDHPISDDVADVAAATPTDGAKLALPVIAEKEESLNMLSKHLNQLMINQFSYLGEKLKRLSEKPFFQNPHVLIQEHYQNLDEKESRIREAYSTSLQSWRNTLLALKDITMLAEKNTTHYSNKLDQLKERLYAFSPLQTLQRGYSLVYQKEELIRDAKKINMDEDISIRFHSGSITATPKSIEPDNKA